MSELMDVVDDQDIVIGQATQAEIYEKKLTHRIVHVFVLHPDKSKVYLQKRSKAKSYLPGYWCTSAGGHVRTGESYEQAAKRELREEIGLLIPIKEVHKTEFILNDQKRLIRLFLAYAEEGFNFADGEVAAGEFLSLDAADALIKKGEKIHPQLDVCYQWVLQNRESL